jgi:hypothetical protein
LPYTTVPVTRTTKLGEDRGGVRQGPRANAHGRASRGTWRQCTGKGRQSNVHA